MIPRATYPQADLILHSIGPSGQQLYTFHARYWRPIHSEVMTHRKFGRNARSSRAVPTPKLLREPIVTPLVWGGNQSGMQSESELRGWRLLLAKVTWSALARITRVGVRVLYFAGLHKQWANRPLEWFGQIDVLITTSDLNNWFALRDHSAAQPEIRELARDMHYEIERSKPKTLALGEWHLPFVTDEERSLMPIDIQLQLSVARCARISYKPFDSSQINITADLELYDKLLVQQPLHASPAEHQARPDYRHPANKAGKHKWRDPHLHGNLTGWVQYRKTLPNEWVPG